MTDIFVSYKREDEVRVGRLVQALEKAGLNVWWDRGLPGGESWRENIQKHLDGAKCVIVAWTEASVSPAGDFVRDEASKAKLRGILVPVLLERVAPPLGFGEMQAIDLVKWRGSTNDPFFRDVVAAAQAKIEGRDVPPARGPMARLVRRLTAGAIASGALAAAWAIGTNVLGVQNQLCAIPAPGHIISDACGALRLGERPTRDERIAWDSREVGSCAALQTHIERFPNGAYRERAADMYAARRQWNEETWVRATRLLNIYVGSDAPASPNRAAAEAAARTRGQALADRRCRDFAVTGAHRFSSASIEPQEWICTNVSGGTVCAFDGRASCELEEQEMVARESCEGGAAN